MEGGACRYGLHIAIVWTLVPPGVQDITHAFRMNYKNTATKITCTVTKLGAPTTFPPPYRSFIVQSYGGICMDRIRGILSSHRNDARTRS